MTSQIAKVKTFCKTKVWLWTKQNYIFTLSSQLYTHYSLIYSGLIGHLFSLFKIAAELTIRSYSVVPPPVHDMAAVFGSL